MRFLNHFYCFILTILLIAVLTTSVVTVAVFNKGLGVDAIIETMDQQRLAEQVAEEAYNRFSAQFNYLLNLEEWIPKEVMISSIESATKETLHYVGGNREAMAPIALTPFEDAVFQSVLDKMTSNPSLTGQADMALELLDQGVTDLSALKLDKDLEEQIPKVYESVKGLEGDERKKAFIQGMIWPEGRPNLLSPELDVYAAAEATYTENPIDLVKDSYAYVKNVVYLLIPALVTLLLALILFGSRTIQGGLKWIGLAAILTGGALMNTRMVTTPLIMDELGRYPLWLQDIMTSHLDQIIDQAILISMILLGVGLAAAVLSFVGRRDKEARGKIGIRLIATLLLPVAFAAYGYTYYTNGMDLYDRVQVFQGEMETKSEDFAQALIDETGITQLMDDMSPF